MQIPISAKHQESIVIQRNFIQFVEHAKYKFNQLKIPVKWNESIQTDTIFAKCANIWSTLNAVENRMAEAIHFLQSRTYWNIEWNEINCIGCY